MDGHQEVVEGVFSRWIGGRVKCRVRRSRGTIYDVEWKNGRGQVLRLSVDLSNVSVQRLLLSMCSGNLFRTRVPRNTTFTLPSVSRPMIEEIHDEETTTEPVYSDLDMLDADVWHSSMRIGDENIHIGAQIECSADGEQPHGSGEHSSTEKGEEKVKKKRPRTFAALIGEEPSYVCPHCFLTFSRSFNLGRHIDSKHTRKVHFTCPHCEKTYRHARHFADHLRLHAGQKFSCPTCEEELDTRNSLNAHIRRHHTGKVNNSLVVSKRSRRNRTYPPFETSNKPSAPDQDASSSHPATGQDSSSMPSVSEDVSSRPSARHRETSSKSSASEQNASSNSTTSGAASLRIPLLFHAKL